MALLFVNIMECVPLIRIEFSQLTQLYSRIKFTGFYNSQHVSPYTGSATLTTRKNATGYCVLNKHSIHTTSFFKASWQSCEKRLLASPRLSVSLTIRMEQLGSHWADFHEI
jgi:hypothetical protein